MTESERIGSIKRYGGKHLRVFDLEDKTHAVCLAAVQDDGSALKYVPAELLTNEFLEKAAAQNGMVLRYIPESLKTREICLAAVKNDWASHAYVPQDIFTCDFILEAKKSAVSIEKKFQSAELFQDLILKGGPNFIFSFPKKYLTRKICLLAINACGVSTAAEAVRKNPEIFTRLHPSLCDYECCKLFTTWELARDNDLPPRFYEYRLIFGYKHLLKWPDIALQVLQANEHRLVDVPAETLTEEMCIIALKRNAALIEVIPEKLRTRILCEIASEQKPGLIKTFPEEFITSEMAWRAIRDDAYSLEYIPDHLKTEEMCLEALKKESYCLKYVPENLKTREMCVLAVKSGASRRIKDIPAKFLDKEMCLMTDCRLDNIPKELWDYDICYKAVSSSWIDFPSVPEKFIDEKMCLAALKGGAHSYTVFERLPADKFTSEIAKYAQSYYDLPYIPREFLKYDNCIRIFFDAITAEEYGLKHAKGNPKYQGCVQKALAAFPAEFVTQQFFNDLFRVKWTAIEYFPEEFITLDMIIEYYAKVNPYNLKECKFPEKFKNKESLDKIVEYNPDAEKYIEQYRT